VRGSQPRINLNYKDRFEKIVHPVPSIERGNDTPLSNWGSLKIHGMKY